MTAKEAYEILRKEYPLYRVRGCLDYGSFFVFSLAPFNISDDESYYTGITMDAVDKKTGRTYKYDLTEDIDAYEKAQKIEVKDFLDHKMLSEKEIQKILEE